LNGRSAFTLVELVLVLAIIATFAAIAAPRYANALTNYRADGISRRIAADLELARMKARQTSTDVTVTFDVLNNRYDIPAVPSLHNPGVGVGVDLSVEPYRAELISVSFGGDQAVVYDGYGIPDSGGSVTLSCGLSLKVIQLSETGIINVQ
jgi:prepilin-type N-terminal cleavage/methylation domain-containing protein